MNDLWTERRDKILRGVEPLAVRMRPRCFEEFVGQRDFLGEGKLLRRMLEADRLTSVIFYGPPGTGKTTLAEVIAKMTERHYERGNASTIGVKDVRLITEGAIERLERFGCKTILLPDENHWFNKPQ